MKFTDRSLKALTLAPGQKDRIAFDDGCPGLGVRLTASGSRTFIVQSTDKATKRKARDPIGAWGTLTIDQARDTARRRLGEVANGKDPRATRLDKAAADEARRAAEALTLDALIARWAAGHLSKRRPRYAEEAQRALRFAFADHLKRPASRLSQADVIAALDAMAGSGKGTTAGRTKAYGRACFNWALGRSAVPANPFAGVPSFDAHAERERVLSDVETREVVAAATALPYPFGPFFRVALYTLQRREEVAGMRWSELSADLSLWSIPGARMKNGKPHDVHLAEPVRAILRAIPRRAKQDLVFSTTGRTPVSGFSRAKAALDAAIVAARAKAAEEARTEPAALVPWRLHDFRRTGVSRLAATGFDSIVADKLLAHQPAKLKGVAGMYQRHEFADERKRALEAWAAHVDGLARQDSRNVLPMRRA